MVLYCTDDGRRGKKVLEWQRLGCLSWYQTSMRDDDRGGEVLGLLTPLRPYALTPLGLKMPMQDDSYRGVALLNVIG
jgi:hypothetical protein